MLLKTFLTDPYGTGERTVRFKAVFPMDFRNSNTNLSAIRVAVRFYPAKRKVHPYGTSHWSIPPS
jgi:hypothetical protein